MTSKTIVQIRKATGLTQTAFGKQLGFGTPQIRVSELENGRSPISNPVALLATYVLLYGPINPIVNVQRDFRPHKKRQGGIYVSK